MRFNTDQALFDAFPSARDHVKTEPTGGSPAVFLKTLIERGTLEEAISFCAYLLPRREAVAWGCRCFRSGLRDQATGPALLAAEAWAKSPSEVRRREAYALWDKGDKEEPANWLALGAAWSGGGVVPDLPNSPAAAPHLTATMIRVALILLLHSTLKDSKPAVAREWVAIGSRIAEFGL